jgi:hypothetical protein
MDQPVQRQLRLHPLKPPNQLLDRRHLCRLATYGGHLAPSPASSALLTTNDQGILTSAADSVRSFYASNNRNGSEPCSGLS